MKKKMLDYRKFPGLKVFCKKCGYEVHNIGEGGLKTNCSHPIEFQTYKAVFRESSTGMRKTRTLSTSSYNEAVSEVLRFKEELKNPVSAALLRIEVNEKPMTLAICMKMYLDYLKGVGVLEFEKRERNKTYIDNMNRYCNYFLRFLKSMGLETRTIRVDEITDRIVEEYYRYAKNETESNSTFNGMFKPLKGLYRFLIDRRDYLIRNPFKNIPCLAEGGDPISFDYSDVLKIKQAIKPEEAFVYYPSSNRKSMYKDWLADAIDLALFTGVRREQIVVMKWTDIIFDANGKPEYIKSNNLKVNRMQNRNGTKKDKYVHVPISSELKELLIRMGLNENKGKDMYILAPNEKKKRETIMMQMSRSFSFFRIKAGVEAGLSFKNLRKTYISKMEFIMGVGNLKSVTGHSGNAVLKNHYIDTSAVARDTTATGFSLFGNPKGKNESDMWSVLAHALEPTPGD